MEESQHKCEVTRESVYKIVTFNCTHNFFLSTIACISDLCMRFLELLICVNDVVLQDN